VDAAALETAVAALARAAQWAAGFGVTLALEFQGTAGFCTNLETALSLVRACGEPNVGVCLDVFHYYRGPSKAEDLERMTPRDLAWVQLCDVAGVPRELATDADRVLPGDGDFQLDRLLTQIRALGYDGWVSLELFNPVLWQLAPARVAELGFAALRRVLPPDGALRQIPT
jgi:2-keto-myo-inositol isomerase